MGFEPFPAPPPASSLATFHRPRGLPRTRLSHPPKSFPRRQPHCVTAAVASSRFNRCLPLSPSTPKCFPLPLPTCDPLPRTHVATSALPLTTPSPTSRPCSIAESVANAVCCHPASTRYSLGLRSLPGYSPRPRRPFTDTPPRIPCRSTEPAVSCPDRPLCDFRPPAHRCRRHPATWHAVLQRPARRRSGVNSTCFRRHTAEATCRLPARPTAASMPKHLHHCCTDRSKHEPHPASHSTEVECAACPAAEAT